MRTHAYTLVRLCASVWAWSLGVWAAPTEDLQVEHRGTVEVLLPAETPFGDIEMDHVFMPDGGSFMWTGQDGSYRFGLQSEDQWRTEFRNADGIVEGRYVYKNPEGQTVDISYNAGPQGFIAEGDAIPGGRAPLVDAPINDDVHQRLEPTKPVVDEVEGVPYGALRVSSLPGFKPVLRDTNVIWDLEAQAIIMSSIPDIKPVAPDDNTLEDLEEQANIIPGQSRDVWPPRLTFNPLPGTRGEQDTDVIFGPPLMNGEPLVSGVIIE